MEGQILHAVGLFIQAIGRFDFFCKRISSVCTVCHSAQKNEKIDAKHRRRTSPKRPKINKSGGT